MSAPLEATAYLQVKKGQFPGDWRTAARVQRVTQERPGKVAAGCIVVKIRLRIPAEAWEPFRPEAVIDVPADLVQHPVEVVAEDAGGDA